MIDPREIAALITEDPDVFVEMGMSGAPMTSASLSDPSSAMGLEADNSLTSSEITDQAEEISDEETDDQVADEMRAQQEKEQAEKEQRRRMLEPQMQQMDKSINSLNKGVTQGGAQAGELNQSLGGLDMDIDALKTALQSFEKSVF